MFKKIAHVDFETFSKVNLPKCGLFRYAEDESTEILCVAFAINKKQPELWLPFKVSKKTQQEIARLLSPYKVYFNPTCPSELKSATQYRAHNADFEITIGNSEAGKKIDFPQTSINQWVCTAAKSAFWGLPRALKDACKHLKTAHQKDETARNNMLQLSKPKKPSKTDPTERYTLENHFEKFITEYKYCIDDVFAERDVDYALEDIPKNEQYLYRLNYAINKKGVYCDLDSVDSAICLKDEYKHRLTTACKKITGFKASQRDRLSDWIRENGCDIPDLTADTVRDRLKTEKNPTVKKVLRIRQLHEMKTPEKYTKMKLAASYDGRLRGMFLYYGASTGRWSSKIVQLQNLFRGGLIKDTDTLIDFYKHRDIDIILQMYEDAMYAFSSSIRGMLASAPGKTLNCADYIAIEGGIVAWLANDQKKLKIYRTHGKVYEHTAAQLFSMDDSLEALKEMKTKFPQKRFAGKTSELALGYQGAVGALQRMAKKEGVQFSDEEALNLVRRWRNVNPKTKTLWNNLDHYAIQAVRNPGAVYKTNKVMFKSNGHWLQMRLPSGRKINYYKPKIGQGQYGDAVTYMGVHTKSRQYCRVDTYGGRLTENAASGIARDVMAGGMVRLHKKGFGIIGSVHDEVISEDDDSRIEEMCEVMCDVDGWAKDIPLKADGWSGKRYRK